MSEPNQYAEWLRAEAQGFSEIPDMPGDKAVAIVQRFKDAAAEIDSLVLRLDELSKLTDHPDHKRDEIYSKAELLIAIDKLVNERNNLSSRLGGLVKEVNGYLEGVSDRAALAWAMRHYSGVVERRCSFSAPVFEDGVHHPCVRLEGHKGPHELEPGHYIHGDDCEPLCSDCPPAGYPTDKTRCHKCPRRSSSPPEYAEPPRCGHREGWKVCILPPGHNGGHLSG